MGERCGSAMDGRLLSFSQPAPTALTGRRNSIRFHSTPRTAAAAAAVRGSRDQRPPPPTTTLRQQQQRFPARTNTSLVIKVCQPAPLCSADALATAAPAARRRRSIQGCFFRNVLFVFFILVGDRFVTVQCCMSSYVAFCS